MEPLINKVMRGIKLMLFCETFTLFVTSCDQPMTCESSIRKSVTPVDVTGTIIAKIIDTPNRAQPNFILADSSKYEPCNYDIYLKAKTGDIIIKKAGTLKQALISGKDTTYFYPLCDKEPVMDEQN